jgi:SUMO ligase MMS21 Smc5/6 complex component
MDLKKFLLISVALFSQHNLCLERIQSQSVNKAEVDKIYIASGLVSLVVFPCVINEAIVGNSSLVSSRISEKDSNSLILSLSGPERTSTNLIVKCVSQSDPYVFDVVSSKRLHQDYLRISAGYGGPKRRGEELKLLNSSKSKTSGLKTRKDSVVLRPKRLIKTYQVGSK